MGIATFFFYGQGNLDDENEDDILTLLVQAKGGMYYNRAWGSNAKASENEVSELALQVGLRYDLASQIAQRNLEVSNGSGGYPDRRVIASQQTIAIDKGADGSRVARVYYIPIGSSRIVKNVPIGLGGG